MSADKKRNPSIVVTADKGSTVAAITTSQDVAAWLMSNIGKVIKPKNTKKVLVFNKASGFGTHVEPETAAYMLGLTVNGRSPGGKCIVYENHALWFVIDDNRERIVDTRVPAPKAMAQFLKLAAQNAGVPEEEQAKMFPALKADKTILVLNPVDDTGITAEPGSILVANAVVEDGLAN
ncbi:MAG: hypothetical protein WCV86_05480 [Patescibacteria group bacterium]|jgi:hypothetical protein